MSALSQAVRELWGNAPPAPATPPCRCSTPVLSTLIWTVGLTAVLAPLALRAFQRRTST